MTRNEFRNALNFIRFINKDELGSPDWWPYFRDNPIGYFLRCDDANAAIIWAVVEKQMQAQAEAEKKWAGHRNDAAL